MTEHQKPLSTKQLRSNPLTIANQITIVRILLIPVIIICLVSQHKLWAFSLLAFSIFTDFFDGFIARLTKEQSLLGAFLDPLADKLLVTAVYLVLAILNMVDMWVFVVIFSRDLLIVLGWVIIFILTQSNKITPRLLGKIATATQMLASLAFIASVSYPWIQIVTWITVTISIASAIEYIVVGEGRLGGWS